MKKSFLLLFLISPVYLVADTKLYLSCPSQSQIPILDGEKLWIYIDKNNNTFNEITEDAIKKNESYNAGRIFDLKETSEFYNSLNRTTLIYTRASFQYQCRITSREVVLVETKKFLSNFLINRKL